MSDSGDRQQDEQREQDTEWEAYIQRALAEHGLTDADLAEDNAAMIAAETQPHERA